MIYRRLGLLVVLAALAVGASGCNWLQFRFGPDHTGYSASENGVGLGNVSTLTQVWTGHTGGPIGASPAIANGVAYVNSFDNKLYAFDSEGNTNCSGTPKTCLPLWTATIGGGGSSPAIANGVVYIVGSGFSGDILFAFDATGVTNCAATPKTCLPLWSAALGGTGSASVTVAYGVVYIGADFGPANGVFAAFDASGITNCSGSPKTCSPLWTATTGAGVDSSAAVANGVVYVGSIDENVYAFDATGTTNCSGSPKKCSPLWTGRTGGRVLSSPAVTNGVVYVGSEDHNLYAFNATGTTNCSGSPKSCSPLWTAATGGAIEDSSPAVANGIVYVGAADNKLYAFDATGTNDCSGKPKSCSSLWTATTAGVIESSPAVANGIVYVGSGDNHLYAYDALGTTNCSGSPKTCTPLWSATTGNVVYSSPAVANGAMYVGSYDDSLHVYALP